MMKIKTAISIILLLFTASLTAQLGSNPLKKGNELYQEGKFDEAEVRYRKAMAQKEEENLAGRFNLGDALYRQQRYEEAATEFARVAELSQDPELKAQALHNLGNSMVQQKKYKEAVEAYKQALKTRPAQEDSRENLARALRELQQQQQQQNQQNQNQEQNKKEQDQKKNDKKQNQQQQDQQQEQAEEDRPKPDQAEEQQQQQQSQPRKDRISREDAERLLKAINADEQKVQEKVNKEKIKGRPVQTEKDW